MATPNALKRASNLSKAAMAIRAAAANVLTVFIVIVVAAVRLPSMEARAYK